MSHNLLHPEGSGEPFNQGTNYTQMADNYLSPNHSHSHSHSQQSDDSILQEEANHAYYQTQPNQQQSTPQQNTTYPPILPASNTQSQSQSQTNPRSNGFFPAPPSRTTMLHAHLVQSALIKQEPFASSSSSNTNTNTTTSMNPNTPGTHTSLAQDPVIAACNARFGVSRPPAALLSQHPLAVPMPLPVQLATSLPLGPQQQQQQQQQSMQTMQTNQQQTNHNHHASSSSSAASVSLGQFAFTHDARVSAMQLLSSTAFQSPLSLPSQTLDLSNLRSDIDLVMDTQPPVEVRTRTPREVRNFSVIGSVIGRSILPETQLLVKAELYYAPNEASDVPQPVIGGDRILGGTTIVNVQSNGIFMFNNLNMSEASAKHNERDFCLCLTILGGEPMTPIFRKFTRSFYTFSHKKVLERRRNVKLRTLSCNSGPVEGGLTMHVIGSPFIIGPYFSVLFTTPHGTARATDIDLYSDCVSFFQAPPCPGGPFPPGTEIQAQVRVTNDGRNFSDPLDFTYVVGGGDTTSKKRSFPLSRM